MSALTSWLTTRKSQDGYNDVLGRQVLLHYGRYRVTKSGVNKSYSLWYGGSILKIDNRSIIIDQFKQRVAEMQGINT